MSSLVASLFQIILGFYLIFAYSFFLLPYLFYLFGKHSFQDQVLRTVTFLVSPLISPLFFSWTIFKFIWYLVLILLKVLVKWLFPFSKFSILITNNYLALSDLFNLDNIREKWKRIKEKFPSAAPLRMFPLLVPAFALFNINQQLIEKVIVNPRLGGDSSTEAPPPESKKKRKPKGK